MPTTKERINITIDQPLYDELSELASRKHIPLAAYAKKLIETALIQEEDRYFSSIADERLNKPRSLVEHGDAWA